MHRLVATALILLAIAGAAHAGDKPMQIISPAFTHMGALPKAQTCDGGDVSPPLAWAMLPSRTESLVLIVDDPDVPDPAAPKRTWVHWVLYNLPAHAGGLPAGIAREHLPAGTHEGLNDWGKTGYGGACPPVGRHRYFHKLYALDIVLPDLGPATKAQVEEAMQGHVLEHAELVGTYQR